MFIGIANRQTNAIATAGLADTSVLADIELMLAAHYVSLRDPAPKSVGMGPVNTSFDKGSLGEGLKATYWGQQALALDTTGTLAGVGVKRASIRALPT